MSRGVGNTLLAPWLEASFSAISFVTWNARALHHHKPCLRKAKKNFIQDFLKRNCAARAVLAMQEVHGTPEKIYTMLFHLKKLYYFFHSFSRSTTDGTFYKEDEGSVITLIPKGCTPSRNRFVSLEVIPGRALRVSWTGMNRTWIHWNIHNHGLSAAQVSTIAGLIRADVATAQADPTMNFLVVSGDFNFLAPGDFYKSISDPGSSTHDRHDSAAPRPHQTVWQQTFDLMTEIQQPYETHYSSSSNLLGRLSRLYVASPAWLILQLGLRGKLLRDPLWCHEQGISDHAPVAFHFAAKPQLPPDQRPIPRYVIDHPRFPKILENLTNASNIDELSVPLRLKEFKVLMREASRITRDEVLAGADESVAKKSTLCASVARAVWHNDTRLARTLIARSEFARMHIFIDDGVVSVRDPDVFSNLYNSARADALALRRRDAERALASSPASDRRLSRIRLATIERLGKIWSPFGKQLPIHAIKVGDVSVTDDSGKLDALADAWAPTFSHAKPIDEAMAETVAEQLSSKYDIPDYAPPSSAFIGHYLRQVRNSAPGKDGIPYSAWFRAGPRAWLLLHQVAVWLCSGFGMLIDFNEALFVFIAKGVENDDQGGITREPIATRPLGLKNADVKAVSGATYALIKRAVGLYASRLQRGFVQMRNFLDNIVDLDAHSRLYSMRTDCFMPICLFTDFGAAFPSLNHKWLFIALKASNLPAGLICFIEGIFASVIAVGRANLESVILFLIRSGVIQGCPLASFCFVLAFDPFLNLFDRIVEEKKHGAVRACADDVGFALTSLNILPKVATVFKLAKRLAGLAVKFKKSCIVPLCAWSPSVSETIRMWLFHHLPGWVDITIAPRSKYLGYYLGPNTSEHVWLAPAAKWKTRAGEITASRAPPSVAVHLYNTFALPTLTYVAQLALPPKHLVAQERHVLTRLIHAPPNAFSRTDCFSLAGWGSVRIRSMYVDLIATAVRAATCTISTWEENHSMLIQSDWRSLAMMHCGQLAPDFWDSPPIASTLRDASLGFPGHPLLGGILPEIIAEAKRSRAILEPGKKFKFQRFIAERLRAALYPDSIPALVKRRYSVLDPGVPFEEIVFEEIKLFISRLSPAWATSILKTWANAWTTSYRMHEPTLRSCVFGCPGERDDLHHYLRCQSLFDLLGSGSDMAPPAVTELLLLAVPSRERAVRLVTIFNAYHGVKNADAPQLQRLVDAARAQALSAAPYAG